MTLQQRAARNLPLTQTRIPVSNQEEKLKTISVATHIPSPPDVMWKILTDFPTYADWNPFIVRASGDPKIGHKLSIRIVPPAGGGMTFRPRVTAVEPEHLLEWFGTLRIQGLFDGRHAFVLKKAHSEREAQCHPLIHCGVVRQQSSRRKNTDAG
jgi:hypothetical protein